MSCSTISTVMPSSVFMSRIQNDMSSVSSTFSPDDGSSSRISFGSEHSARQLDHLADAVRQSGDQLVAIGLEIEKLDHLLDAAAMKLFARAHTRQEQQFL